MRFRSLLLSLLLGGLVLGAPPAPAQETSSTWGRIKQLYTGDETPLIRGAGVSPAAADAAYRAARARARQPWTGPVVVRTLARSERGVVLVVHARTAAGDEAAHLVDGNGSYIRGVELVGGLFRDAETGETLLRLDPGDGLEPLGVEGFIRDFTRQMGSLACNALATVVMEKCMAVAVVAAGLPGALGCLAAGGAVLLACEAMMNMNYQLEDPEMGEPGQEYQPGGSPGDTSGG